MKGVVIMEVASLKEGKWSCYRGCHFNGGRKVIRGSEVEEWLLQRTPV